jgi:hypothetical protein
VYSERHGIETNLGFTKDMKIDLGKLTGYAQEIFYLFGIVVFTGNHYLSYVKEVIFFFEISLILTFFRFENPYGPATWIKFNDSFSKKLREDEMNTFSLDGQPLLLFFARYFIWLSCLLLTLEKKKKKKGRKCSRSGSWV